MDIYETAKEWAEEHVEAFFLQWCSIVGRYAGYDIERFDFWGDTIKIVENTSCMGCYSNEQHILPLAWFYADRETREALIRADMKEKAEAVRLKSKETDARRIAQLRQELAALEAKGIEG